MKTIKQWKAILPGLRHELRNTEARYRRASDNRWDDYVECEVCHTLHFEDISQKAIDKYALKGDLAVAQRTYIYAIQGWLWTLKQYNKGEPTQ